MIQIKENMEKAEKYLKRHNIFVNYLDKNKGKIEKYEQDLERYELIADYFENNPSRVLAGRNFSYLDRIYDSLIKSFPEKIDISDEDIQKKIKMLCIDKESNNIFSRSKELGDRLKEMTCDSILKKIGKIKEKRLAEGKPI